MAYVISNLRLGDSHYVSLSRAGIDRLLAGLVAVGADRADSRWERELVAWLGHRRDSLRSGDRAGLDLGEIAWTPERFPEQRAFLLALLEAAGEDELGSVPEVAPALRALRRLIEDYPREIVVVGRRWAWNGRAPELR